jgi:hypothetical protein
MNSVVRVITNVLDLLTITLVDSCWIPRAPYGVHARAGTGTRGGETYGDGGAILARAASENFVNCSARAEHGY